MSLIDELESRVSSVFSSSWQYVDARVVPETKSIGLGNHGKKLTATVLYADLDSSTQLVQSYTREFAAEIYKVFLYCASRLISSEGGQIRSFDGDRVMGVFNGSTPNTDAVKAALKINYAAKKVIAPRLLGQYPRVSYKLKHTVGIDCSDILVIRGGVRDNNDLAWIGNAANIAAKLNALSSDYPTWITHRVFDKMAGEAKYGGSPRRLMWDERKWSSMDNMRIYRSNWWWAIP
ncbi:adenylate/guanylate cyclase domain-containing protein [Leisingera caerulea]|uniref:adenylate/guanylate cyclase domain-containing protein n=1 Tax=Leisingera caerulea TaxID=506591 RepID=UPI0021A8D7BF|nr:adenylate/guanylate cyclase domain-containing protein [Leisingera caerulea]UWQ84571.1 adenylate/guanylate cyclase domain-containing protein [Leisingera caerulea]